MDISNKTIIRERTRTSYTLEKLVDNYIYISPPICHCAAFLPKLYFGAYIISCGYQLELQPILEDIFYLQIT